MNTNHTPTRREQLAARFAARPGDFVYLSDILGSDWGMGMPDCRGNYATYCAQAYEVADMRDARRAK